MPERDDRVLVVEDDPGMRELLADELTDAGFRVRLAADLESARRELAEANGAVDLLLVDLRLPDGLGTELLHNVRGLPVPPALLVMTAFGSIREAVAALRQGVDDFLTKPLDLEHLRLRIERLLELRRLRGWAHQVRDHADDRFHGMIGRSEPMRRLFAEIRQIARAPGAVLIVGESGSGKERVARALHLESPRAHGPFVPVNCAAIPESLVESELFGHAAGAFSGASGARRGLFEEADGGTLLLDELTELPAGLQAKLLRVLQQDEVRRVGENAPRSVDVRVLAATNREPLEALEAGSLRQDLYYRLETFQLRVPPLRERRDDIELLAAHFLGLYRAALDKRVEGFSEAALERLVAYAYPGNVRELASVVQRAVTLGQSRLVQLGDLPERVRRGDEPARRPTSGGARLVEAGELPPLDTVRDRYVRYVLAQCDGNKRRAAETLGIGRRTLYRYLEEPSGGAEPGG